MNEYVKNLNRIEFVVTMACTGKCKHCSEGEHVNCKDHIDADIAVTSIREALSIVPYKLIKASFAFLQSEIPLIHYLNNIIFIL